MTHDAVKLFNPDRLTVDDPVEKSAKEVAWNAGISPATIDAELFLFIWRKSGGTPGQIQTTWSELVAALPGRSLSGIRKSLRETLPKRGLVGLPNGTGAGAFQIDVMVGRPKSELQATLFDVIENTGFRPRLQLASELAGTNAQKVYTDSARAHEDGAQEVYTDRPSVPDEVLELQQKIERKRSQAFVARDAAPQRVPACDMLRSQISVSVSSETKNRDLGAEAAVAKKPSVDSYGGGLSLESLADKIRRDVGPGLYRTVSAKIAEAVVSGHLDGDRDVLPTIRRAHDLVASGECPSAFVYFVSAMQKKFSEVGLPWHRSGRRRRSTRGP